MSKNNSVEEEDCPNSRSQKRWTLLIGSEIDISCPLCWDGFSRGVHGGIFSGHRRRTSKDKKKER